MDRGERRVRTERVALRRWRDHKHFSHYLTSRMQDGKSNFQCFCDGMGIHVFDKRTPWTHNCRKRKHGQPKRGGGICKMDGRPHVIMERQLAREIRRLKVDPRDGVSSR